MIPYFLYFAATILLGILAAWIALRGKQNSFPNVMQSVALLFTGFFFQQASFVVGNRFDPTTIEPSSALSLFSSFVYYGVPVVLGLWRTGISRMDFAAWFGRVKLPIAGYAIFIGVGLLGLSEFLTGALRSAGVPTLPHMKPSLTGLLIAPVFEEVLFRGLILRGLLKSRSKIQVIAISSVLFALVHGDVSRMPALTLAGIAYAVVTIESGTLWYSIIAHSAYNGTIHLFAGLNVFFPGLEQSEGINALIASSFVVLGVFSLLRLRGHFRRFEHCPNVVEGD